MMIFGRVFNRLYPSKPKETDTEEGDSLRRALGWSTFLHGLFFLMSLTTIGFISMLTHIILGVWCYSSYLTLREWQVIIYLCFMALACCAGPFTIGQYPNSF